MKAVTSDEQVAAALGVTPEEWRAAIGQLGAAFGPPGEVSADLDMVETAVNKGRISQVSGIIHQLAPDAVTYDISCKYNQGLGWGWELTCVTLSDGNEVDAESFDHLHEATLDLLTGLPWMVFDADDDDTDERRTIEIATGQWSRTE